MSTNKSLNQMRDLNDIAHDALQIIDELTEKVNRLKVDGEDQRMYKANTYLQVIKELIGIIQIKESQIQYLNDQIVSNGKVQELNKQIQKFRTLCYSHGIDPRKHIFY